MEKVAEIGQVGEKLDLLRANGILIDTEVEEEDEEENLGRNEGSKCARYCYLHCSSHLKMVVQMYIEAERLGGNLLGEPSLFLI